MWTGECNAFRSALCPGARTFCPGSELFYHEGQQEYGSSQRKFWLANHRRGKWCDASLGLDQTVVGPGRDRGLHDRPGRGAGVCGQVILQPAPQQRVKQPVLLFTEIVLKLVFAVLFHAKILDEFDPAAFVQFTCTLIEFQFQRGLLVVVLPQLLQREPELLGFGPIILGHPPQHIQQELGDPNTLAHLRHQQDQVPQHAAGGDLWVNAV